MKDLEKDSKTNPKSTSKKSKPKKYEKTENVFVFVSCFITKIVWNAFLSNFKVVLRTCFFIEK